MQIETIIFHNLKYFTHCFCQTLLNNFSKLAQQNDLSMISILIKDLSENRHINLHIL